MSKKTILIIATFILLFNTGTAAADPNATDITKNIESQQHKIKRVQEEIEDHRQRVRDTRTQETNLFDQLEIINQALNEGRKRLAELNEQTAAQEELIKEKASEVARRNVEKEAVKEHVKERLAAFYRMGDLGVMNVTFSAGSLPDLLNFNEYFKSLIKYDQQVIYDYRLKIEKLIETQKILEGEKGKLLESISTVKNQEKHLESVREERVALLARITTEKKLYRRAIDEMEEASVRLTETLAELRKKLVTEQDSQQRFYSSPKKRRPGSYKGFVAMKGRLYPPVRGAVTTFFGKNAESKFGLSTQAYGIDIKTLAGSEIIAIYDGKVVYSGPLKGYGNLIIIDHGNQYYSLVSRAAELYRKEGDAVSTGEAIGIMNESGGLLGEGLHFEIRHGTEPQDPLDWVNKKLLNVGSRHATIQAGKTKVKNN